MSAARCRRLALAVAAILALAAATPAQGPARGSLPQSGSMEAALRVLVQDIRPTVVPIEADGKTVAYATVVDDDGHLVTKASLLPEAPELRLGPEERVSAELVGVDEELDLAVLRVEETGLTPAAWAEEDALAVGQILISVGPDREPLGVGVLSVLPRPIPEGSAYLGVSLRQEEGGVAITQVVPDSAAAAAGLEVGDVFLTINGEEETQMPDLIARVREMSPEDKVVLRLRRGDGEIEVEAVLGERPQEPAQGRSARANGPQSERRTGFATALQHDTVLKPAECGSPVVNLAGEIIALNIARSGRVESLAIPAGAARASVKRLLERARVPQR